MVRRDSTTSLGAGYDVEIKWMHYCRIEMRGDTDEDIMKAMACYPIYDLRIIDVQAVSAILCVGFCRSCGVDAVLSSSSKPIARTWRGHMTVTIHRDDEDGR